MKIYALRIQFFKTANFRSDSSGGLASSLSAVVIDEGHQVALQAMGYW